MSLVSVFQELEQEPQARETLKRLEQHLQVRLEQLAPRVPRTLQPTLNSPSGSPQICNLRGERKQPSPNDAKRHSLRLAC